MRTTLKYQLTSNLDMIEANTFYLNGMS